VKAEIVVAHVRGVVRNGAKCKQRERPGGDPFRIYARKITENFHLIMKRLGLNKDLLPNSFFAFNTC